MTHQVLIGYEPTPQGEDALALGGLLCDVVAARPLIATALPYSRTAMGLANLEKSLEMDTKAMLEAARDRLRWLKPESRAIRSHSPAHGLTELAAETGASLIVVGSTHRSPLGRIVFGSTAEGLLQGAAAPVAVAPRGFGEDQPRHLLRFGVCYDGSPEAEQALETGIELAGRVHGSLTVLSVADRTMENATSIAILAGAEPVTGEYGRVARLLDSALERVPVELPAEGRVLEGSAVPAILEASAGFDLLLLGSRGRGPLLRTTLGSVSGPIARNAPCPVLVLPRGAGAEALALGGAAARGGGR